MDSINIIKVGGGVIEDAKKLDTFLDGFANLNEAKILVHGGGSRATEIGEKLGLEAIKVDGRRVTNDDYLEVVTMVYGGLINKQLVAKLQKRGCQAIGLTGADGDYLRSMKRPVMDGIDYGWVGDPVNIRSFFLIKLLKDGLIPVAAPLTHDGAGNMLNTNADTIASTIASALSENYRVNLIYAFELDGVLKDIKDPTSLIRTIDMKGYAGLKKSGGIFDGMIPKLDNAFDAIAKGVASVKIVKYDAIDKLGFSSFKDYTHIA